MNSLKCLLIFRHPVLTNAPTIMDHVNSFKSYSLNYFININTEYGFPQLLRNYRFDLIVLHYSLFGSYPFSLPPKFVDYIRDSKESVKVAFFQDEYQYCIKRYKLIDELRISIIYSLLEEENLKRVYNRCESVKYIYSTLAGYVSQNLEKVSKLLFKPSFEREIDIGYRARKLSYLLGKGAKEKSEIATGFTKSCGRENFKIDISTSDNSRLYGSDWYEFIANCKGMLGVEAGASIFDIDGLAEMEFEGYLKQNPNCNFDEIYTAVLASYEHSKQNIYYRMISPRIFEAAAFKVCLILFEGNYSGLLQPNVHYISLKKDFSNIKEVLHIFKDFNKCNTIVKNAYSHLIESRSFTYKNFIDDFDEKISFLTIGRTPSVQNLSLLEDRLRSLQKKYYFEYRIKTILKRILKKLLHYKS